MNTVDTYLNLITSLYANQPDFNSVIEYNVTPQLQVQNLLLSMLPLFDLDTPPKGDQLDIIGQWVGVSRVLKQSISGTGVFFTWDDTTLDGWDSGTWQPPGDPPPTEITDLPDDAYLTLIKAKIAANAWNGTTEGAYAVWEILFPHYTILISDNQDMTYAILILSSVIDALSLALLTGGYIQLKPEGVGISGYFLGSPPVFAWDVVSSIFNGWDTGNWAVEIAPGT